MELTLFSNYLNSAGERVRIALAYYGVEFDTQPVHLVEGKQQTPDYLENANAMGQVPEL